MVRMLLLVAGLMVLPMLGRAEEMLRWQDADGVLHYTNVPDKAPANAETVTTTIGHATPRSAGVRRGGGGAPKRLDAEPAYMGGGRHANAGCCPYGAAYTVIMNNPHEPADQVKQASVLDMLHVPWRHGCN